MISIIHEADALSTAAMAQKGQTELQTEVASEFGTELFLSVRKAARATTRALMFTHLRRMFELLLVGVSQP